MSNLHSAVILVLLLALQACSTPPGDLPGAEVPPEELQRSGETPESLLRQAAGARGQEAILLRFQAAELLVLEGKPAPAETILAGLDHSTLSASLQADIHLLRAVVAGDLGNAERMLEHLDAPSFPSLSGLDDSYRIRYHRLRAQALADSGAMLDSALERISLDRYLSDAGKQGNHQLIWEALATLPLDELEELASREVRYEVRGWYELALLAKQHDSDLDRQLVELERWRRGWTRHPVADLLPRELQQIEAIANSRPERIALLLPLQSPAGIIVRNAFMGAYYNLLELGGRVPAVRLYDTSASGDVIALYRTAVRDGAELVIGPLLKEEVALLHQQSELPVPTLALNNVEGSTPASRNLYQFSLSPEDEARQSAVRAWNDGHRRVAILHPAEEVRRSNSFAQQWRSLGGEIVNQTAFRDDYTTTISNMLELEQSNLRHRELNRLLGRQTLFEPRRRQDIDFIYLVATPGPARQIVPSLAYLYAGDLPVYASQEVYSGLSRPVDDRDLNGVIFGESPWVLSMEVSGSKGIREHFPLESGQTLRLQAFGMDAFRLYPRLSLLDSNQSLLIPGASGVLGMEENHNIVRHLVWTTIKDGNAAQRD